MKIVSVVGTRPNFTKEYSIYRACKSAGVEEIIIHTGQHYDYSMSQIFFQELEIPKPDYINEILKGRQGYETATMLTFIEDVLIEEKPDVTLVYGDVNSTVAAGLASVKLKIPVAHVEAGLRTGVLYNPEEVNRKVADAVSEVLFPHIQEAYDSLMHEGYPDENVYLVGDLVKDTLVDIVRRFDIKIKRDGYVLATIHRAENTDDLERLTNIVEALIESNAQIKLPLHPRTKNKMIEFGIFKYLEECPRIEIMEPLGYLALIKLMAHSDKVVTDSGGLRREAYMLEKPVITLIDIIWVQSLITNGWKKVCDADKGKIIDAIQNHNPSGPRDEIFGDGHAAEKMIKILLERFG